MSAKGFTAVYLIGLILIIITGAVIALNKDKIPLFIKNAAITQPNATAKPFAVSEFTFETAVPKTISSTIPSQTPKAISTPVAKPVVTTPASAFAPSPTPSSKTITVSGFAYEDRTDDGLFNSDDPKKPYMQFLIYDSATNEWINTIYSGQDGTFAVTNTVQGNLILKPTCNDNFCPKDSQKEFSSSTSNLQFGFRSASAPTGSNNGVIEGDLIGGSQQYKFYLLDKNGNYYSNIDWAGGHFKIQNLPNNKTYLVRISYGDGSPSNTEVTLTPSSPEQKTVQIHLR